MDFLINYWYVILGILALLAVAGFAVYKFAGLPTESQIEKVKEWLLYAVIQAEKELGSGTGQIKLRKVYDAFLNIKPFAIVANFISFETFSKWVDEALAKMEDLLESESNVKEYVENGTVVASEVSTDDSANSTTE